LCEGRIDKVGIKGVATKEYPSVKVLWVFSLRSPHFEAGITVSKISAMQEGFMKGNILLIRVSFLVGLLVAILLPARIPAQETETLDKDTAAKVFPKEPYSPHVGRVYPTRVYFGDTHLHTSQSFDSVMFDTREIQQVIK
jgi:hypothetical protein